MTTTTTEPMRAAAPHPDRTDSATAEVRARAPAAPRNWPKRVGWLLLIWAASVAALGAAALALRLVMRLIGMSP